MAAAAGSLRGLKDEASCSVCLEFYTDPMATECGHNFCRPCLSQYWGPGATQGLCPECRQLCDQRGLRRNHKLQNMVELLKNLPEGSETPPEGSVCEKHQERVKVFCETEERAICTVCSLSAEHRGHTMVPLEETVLEHKESLQTSLKALNKHLEVVQTWTSEQTVFASELKVKFKNEEDRIFEAYRNLKQSLEEMMQQTLTLLHATKETHLGKIQCKVSELEKQQFTLRKLTLDTEEKCMQEDLELLKDVKNHLSRCESVKILRPKDDSDALKRSLQSYTSHYASLLGQIKTFKGSILAEFSKLEIAYLRSFKVQVSLDPDTAHPRLAISEDGKLLEHMVRKQDLADNPKRFTVSHCVLGTEGFTSGMHYWEMQLLQKEGWVVGVALDSIRRKEQVKQSPERGIWALKRHLSEAIVSTPSNLTPGQHPLILGVYLDYEGGQLFVYNAETGKSLYNFNGPSFPGRVFPYFCVWERVYIDAVTRQKIMFGHVFKEEVLRLL